MSVKRRLQLVPTPAIEQTAAKLLSLDESSEINDPQSISAALGLYFQWENRRSCHLILENHQSSQIFDCEMDYDRDESSPSEIRIKIGNLIDPMKVVPGSKVVISFEIFRAQYEFTVPVLATSYQPQIEGWHLIVDVPYGIMVAKNRSSRKTLDEEMKGRLPPIYWVPLGSKTEKVSIEISELGMTSLKAICATDIKTRGILRIGNLEIAAEVSGVAGDQCTFTWNFENSNAFGEYFELYRRVVYPCLKSRYDVPYSKGIELYARANYFGVFNAEKTREEKNNICETWESLKSGFHETNADYYITDNDGEPTGCSGLTITNFSEKKPIWTFHQLCALKNPNLIEESGILYTWRADYLAARPEALSVWGTFRSKSRWLERIYVKHSLNSTKETKLIAVTLRRCTFSKRTDNNNIKFMKFSLGSSNRSCTTSKDIWAGVNPRYLNANDNLETIISVFEPQSIEEIQEFGGQLANFEGRDSLSLVLVTPKEFDSSKLGGNVQVQDRFFVIPKSDLVTLISAVEHSVAVTERKLRNGAVE